jgi:hypothetical protein
VWLGGWWLDFSRFARNNIYEMNETNEYIKNNNINETNDKLNGRVAKIKNSNLPRKNFMHRYKKLKTKLLTIVT